MEILKERKDLSTVIEQMCQISFHHMFLSQIMCLNIEGIQYKIYGELK